jgi:LuxR family maltose regulon positive regulatory protein
MLAKLDVPRSPLAKLVRPRLLDRITTGVSGPLTVVCAPAGSGKTTLLLSWIDAGLAPGPVVWISLDALDRQPGIFWSYVLAGLTKAGVATTGVTPPNHPYRLDPSFLMHLSAALYQRPDPVVLVLDDADAVGDSPLCGQLDFLIRNAGASLRLVMLTRDDPAVSLPRYRLADSVIEIDAGDLAATRDEAAALFEKQRLPASAETLDAILSRTRGWMAGLVLTGQALRDPRQLTRLSGGASPGSEDLDEYLDEEVLGTYPAPVRRFLVRTSVADHLPAGLAEELAGQQGAARVLGELGRHNAFVTGCEDHLDCYRYQPLLQDALRARLEADSPGEVPQLHRRAAAWFLRAGEPTEAAVHAAAAQQWQAAARMLVSGLGITHLLAGPDAARLTWRLADLPADLPGAEAAVVRATIALVRRDTTSCASELRAAQEAARHAGAEPAAALAVSSCLVGGGLAVATGDSDAALMAAAEVERLLGQLPATRSSATARMLALSFSARALLHAGRLEAALATLDDARRTTPPGSDGVRATCDGLAALAEAMRGRLSRAFELAGADPGSPRAAGNATVATQIAVGWVAVDTGDVALARRRSATLTGTEPHDPSLTVALAILHARVHRTDGDPASALRVLDAARQRLHGVRQPTWLDGRLAAETAATWTASSRPDLAVRVLAELSPAVCAEVALELARAELAAGTGSSSNVIADLLRRVDIPLGVRVDALLLRAAEALERGDTATARAAADRALRAAAPERLRRPFLEAPTRLRGFVRHHSGITAGHDWLDDTAPLRPQLVAVQPGPVEPQGAPSVLIEPLTEKEQEVLVHLAELLSTEEIAGLMFVSVNTVRTHVRAILRKLAASRRNEAIRRARALRII